MKEEDNILRKAGLENPFQVPDGYFEQLTSKIMERLPEKEPAGVPERQPSLWDKVKPLIYMAAMFAGAALIIRVALSDRVAGSDVVAVDDSEVEMEYINTVVNNSMLDDYSLYVYLTDADGE